MLFDPQAGYDPISGRLWMVYLEGVASTISSPGLGVQAHLHMAVNKDPAEFPGGGPLDTLADTHWHYYTHDTGTGTKAGAEYDLTLLPSPYLLYKDEFGHHPADATVRLPSVGFDEQAIMVAVNETNENVDGDNVPLHLIGNGRWNQLIYIFPRDHTGGSITDGDRPSEDEVTIIRMGALRDTTDRDEDFSHYYRAVQEPYPNPGGGLPNEQVENATFFISMADPDLSGFYNDIRLRGIYDADPSPTATDWTLQQQTVSVSGLYELIDIGVGQYAHPSSIILPFRLPDTPDSTWEPNAYGGYFQTAVLARDVANEFMIFAVHAIQDVASGEPAGHWIVQWYVIDPDLAGFGSAPDGWQPSIVAQGRLDDEGDRYHPVIVVNRQGQAFIDYTYSDDTTWPSIRRVRLNSGYTAVVGSELPVQGGPATAYDPLDPVYGYWADYADAQADPFNQCAYWSTHTLVTEPPNANPPITLDDRRNVWLFHEAYGNVVTACFQTTSMLDLNDDNEVDTYDMLEFADFYARGARRVDINADGVVDETDLRLYTDAYDAFTRK